MNIQATQVDTQVGVKRKAWPTLPTSNQADISHALPASCLYCRTPRNLLLMHYPRVDEDIEAIEVVQLRSHN